MTEVPKDIRKACMNAGSVLKFPNPEAKDD